MDGRCQLPALPPGADEESHPDYGDRLVEAVPGSDDGWKAAARNAQAAGAINSRHPHYVPE